MTATIRLLTSANDVERYETWIHSQPDPPLWQSLVWRRYQEHLGRETRLYAIEEDHRIEASALVIIDRTAMNFSTWDIPRGPLGAGGAANELLKKIVNDAKADRCITIYLSPATDLTADRLPLTASPRHEQPSATRIIYLTLSDEQILSQMHPKGRYNIHVAEKHGVTVSLSHDAGAFHMLLTTTADRDGFTVGPRRQYETFLRNLPGAFLLLAYAPVAASHDSLLRKDAATPIAGLMGVMYGNTAYYYYGASSYEHRAIMAPFLLQWEAMKFCRTKGALSYDLLGIAPPGSDDDHPWAGISSFKAKFGGTVFTYPPEQQMILRPMAKTLLRAKRRMLG